MPRYVILEHDWPEPHFDFMLEADEGRLRTWRLNRLPGVPDELAAERIADHRSEYLNYEGPVSGNRGSVARRMNGDFHWLTQMEDVMEIKMKLRNERVIAEWSRKRNTWTFRPA